MLSTTKWNQLQQSLQNIKSVFDKSYKCLNKSKLPSTKTQIKHLQILTTQHNSIVCILRSTFSLLTEAHKTEVKNYFDSIKTRLDVLFKRLEIQTTVPQSLYEILDLKFKDSSEVEESENSDTDTEENNTLNITNYLVTDSDVNTSSNNTSTIMTPVEFLNAASKLLPDFDGKFENLQRFLDAISIVDSIKDTHELLAVSLIKSKLTGYARNLINTESTISSIRSTLVANVKGESSQLIAAKLLNTQQMNKSCNEYAKEVEDMTKALQNAFISDGLTPQLAENFALQSAVKCLVNNSKSDKTKIIMQAGQFSSIHQAMTKFVEVSTGEPQNQRVNFVQNKYRGNNRNNYRGRGRRNNQSNRGGRNNSSRNQNYNNNNYRGTNRSNNNNRNMRTIEAVPENGTAPQSAQLGNFMSN